VRFISTSIVGTDALGQLASRKQPIVFDDMTLAVNPLWLDRVQPGTFGGQKEGQDANAFARQLDFAIVFPDPGPHHLAFMPGGVVPDQKPVPLAQLREARASPIEKRDRDGTHGTACDKAQPHLGAIRVVRCSLLPQHSITSQGLGIRIAFLPHLFDQPHRMIFARLRVKTRQRKSAPPHLVEEANGPIRTGAGICDQAITSRFFSRIASLS
jgi:hypothetical protein